MSYFTDRLANIFMISEKHGENVNKRIRGMHITLSVYDFYKENKTNDVKVPENYGIRPTDRVYTKLSILQI